MQGSRRRPSVEVRGERPATIGRSQDRHCTPKVVIRATRSIHVSPSPGVNARQVSEKVSGNGLARAAVVASHPKLLATVRLREAGFNKDTRDDNTACSTVTG